MLFRSPSRHLLPVSPACHSFADLTILATTMERSWHSLHIRLPIAFVDTISALCFDMGSCGTEVGEAGEQALIKAYFPADCAVGAIEAELCSLAETMGVGEMAIERAEVEEADWEAEWRRFFRPVWATPNVVVHPSWIPVDAGDALAITIDPNPSPDDRYS